MKIEIGESLIYSWLRHVKNCQIVQTNWKPSPKWEKNETVLEDIKGHIQKEFKHPEYDIFKKTTTISQFLNQAEIDAVGFSYSNDFTQQKYYLVDVAFHERGLNYGSTNESISRILKKYIRSYFISLVYFQGSSNGSIYFITPKMSVDTILNPLNEQIEALKEIFSRHGHAPMFELLVNEKFNTEVLTPTMKVSDEVEDTNELFLRSVKLWKMFSDGNQPIGHENTHSKEIVETDGIKIGKYVQESLQDLIKKGKISDSEVERLLDPQYSKDKFNLSLMYPFLRRSKDGEINGKGVHAKYYSSPRTINGEKYYLCSQWYEPQRKKFNNWMNGLAKK